MTIPFQCTLLDVVQAVRNYAANDEEVVATVVSLINSGKVVLRGTFTGAQIDFSTPVRLTEQLPYSSV